MSEFFGCKLPLLAVMKTRKKTSACSKHCFPLSDIWAFNFIYKKKIITLQFLISFSSFGRTPSSVNQVWMISEQTLNISWLFFLQQMHNHPFIDGCENFLPLPLHPPSTKRQKKWVWSKFLVWNCIFSFPEIFRLSLVKFVQRACVHVMKVPI